MKLELIDPKAKGSTGGAEVTYRAGGKNYRWVSCFNVQLAPPGGACEG